MGARACWAVRLCVCVPPHPPTPTFLKFVSILAKCDVKIARPNVVGKFGVFYHKKQNAEFYQNPVPQKSTFTGEKKLYKICIDDYDNNEYLVIKVNKPAYIS